MGICYLSCWRARMRERMRTDGAYQTFSSFTGHFININCSVIKKFQAIKRLSLTLSLFLLIWCVSMSWTNTNRSLYMLSIICKKIHNRLRVALLPPAGPSHICKKTCPKSGIYIIYCKNVFSIYLHAQECEVIIYKEILWSEICWFGATRCSPTE